MIRDQFLLDLSRELIVDNFAGGGGASCGNSVSPPLAAALARANVPELMTFNARELRALEAA